jgi:hypothetical protein
MDFIVLANMLEECHAYLNGKLPEWRERLALATNEIKIKIESRAI